MNRNKDLEEAEIIIDRKQNSIEQLIQIVGGFGLKVCIDATTGEVFTKYYRNNGIAHAPGGGFNPGGFNASTAPHWNPPIIPTQFGRNYAAASLATQNLGELQKRFTEMANQQQENYSCRPPTYPFNGTRAAGDQRNFNAFVKFKKEFNKEFSKDPILGRKYLEETNLIGPPKFRRSMMFLFDLLNEFYNETPPLIEAIITDSYFYGNGDIDEKNWEPDSPTSKTKIDFAAISLFLPVYPLGETLLRKPYSVLMTGADNYTKVFFSIACLLTNFYNGEISNEIYSKNIKSIFINSVDKYLETVKD